MRADDKVHEENELTPEQKKSKRAIALERIEEKTDYFKMVVIDGEEFSCRVMKPGRAAGAQTFNRHYRVRGKSDVLLRHKHKTEKNVSFKKNDVEKKNFYSEGSV